MKIKWLGQAGFLLETDGKKILIDPYLSDSVRRVEPQNYRRVPVDERFLALTPDVIVITHNHLDHLDKDTLVHYLTPDAHGLVLAPNGGWQELRKSFPGRTNYVLFNAGTEWTAGEVRFTAVCAEHSDPCAIGVIVSAEGRNYYFTGDTLYSERVFRSLPDLHIDVVFLPVNGVGNNMNMADATRFAQRCEADFAVPVHVGMFDTLAPDAFSHPGKIVPVIYQEVIIPEK